MLLIWADLDLSPYIYGEDNPINNLDIEGMAASDFNIVDPPTKSLPTINNTVSPRTPDPHRVAGGSKIINQAFRAIKIIGFIERYSNLITNLLSPVVLGTADVKPEPNYSKAEKILIDIRNERFTNDPEKNLTPEEKRELGLKVKNGTATENERLMFAKMKAKSAVYKTEFTRFNDVAIGDPRSMWGKSAEEIADGIEKAGYKTSIRQSEHVSKRARIIKVEGHPEIQQIQAHPGGGLHEGAYIKISSQKYGKIKVVDKETYKPTPDEKDTKIL